MTDHLRQPQGERLGERPHQRRRAGQRGAINPQLLRRAGLGLAAVVLIVLLGWGISKLVSGKSEKPRQQVSRIAILPDAPPPPPPPPPKERPPEAPKSEARPQPTPDAAPKPVAANEPIKMEGAAGNGPSAFAAGAVTQDYQGGKPTVGGTAASGPVMADRAAERLYAGNLRQALREEIERQLPTDAGEFNAQFALWVSADGRLQRWELDPQQPADPADRSHLNAALTRSAEQLRLPPPSGLTQPLRFRLTLRAGG